MKTLYFFLSAFTFGIASAQVERSSELFKELKSADSLMFEVGFNTCNIQAFEKLVSDDFEFYHDQSGVIDGRQAFLENTRNGLCKLDYQPIRKLDKSSLEVFPLYNQGELYGAIQKGRHSFFMLKDGKESGPTSSANFSHVWLLEDDQWKLSRVLSYDHQEPNE